MKRKKQYPSAQSLTLILICLAFFTQARAQVAGSQHYTLEQTVIAGGGGQQSQGGDFSLDGTIGQAVAETSSGNSFTVRSGFWTPAPFAPTSASAIVSGRVLTPDGEGLRNAQVILTDAQGESQITMTSTFGYYNFAEITVGQVLVISVKSKRFEFYPQVILVLEDITDLNFTAIAPKVEHESL